MGIPPSRPPIRNHVLAFSDTRDLPYKRRVRDGGTTFLRPMNPVYPLQHVTHLKTNGVVRRLVVTRDFTR